MATGFGPAGAATALNAVAAAYTWVKPHIGAPGADGTSNPATETTRKQVSWNSTGIDGTMENAAQVQWTNVAGSEDWTHVSVWTASSGGSFGFSATVTANALTAGDTATLAAGAIAASVTLAS